MTNENDFKSRLKIFEQFLRKEYINDKQVITELTVGGLIIIIAALVAIKKSYGRYFSQYAKQCIGLSGYDKTKCIRNAKIKTMDHQISQMKLQLVKCSQTKNPEKCKRKVNDEINKIVFKRNKLANK